jgi:hypothetical protein
MLFNYQYVFKIPINCDLIIYLIIFFHTRAKRKVISALVRQSDIFQTKMAMKNMTSIVSEKKYVLN